MVPAALALGTAVAHLAMWPYGFLEEWGFARSWQTTGLDSVASGLTTTAGRPLHLLPAFVGLSISGSRLFGMYLVLAIVAAAQLIAVRWAFRPLGGPCGLVTVAAVAVALHPLWAAGWLLRFLPAQVAVLGLVGWAGYAVRYVRAPRGRMLALAALCLALGLLTYQALALTALLLVPALWMHDRATSAQSPPLRRYAVLLAATSGAVALVAVYTTVLVPRFFPSSYEAALQGGGTDVLASVRQVYLTVLTYPAGLVAMSVALALVILAGRRPGRAGATRRRSITAVLSGVALVAVTPAVALTYASTPLHLRDPERVLLPVTTLLMIVSLLAAQVLARGRPAPALNSLTGRVLLVLVVLPALLTLASWRETGARNYQLLGAVADQVAVAPAGTAFVVVDTGGWYGDVYTWLPPALGLATSVTLEREVDVTLCTADSTVRDHPVAARYPIGTTEDCATLLANRTVVAETALPVDGADALLLTLAPTAP